MWLTPFLYLSRGGSILILAIRRNAVKGLRVEFSGGKTTRPLTEREPASFPVREQLRKLFPPVPPRTGPGSARIMGQGTSPLRGLRGQRPLFC